MKKLLILFLISFVCLSAQANEMLWKKYYRFYRSGEYARALDYLEQMKKRGKQYYYLKALTYKKLQEYDKANEEFKLAIKMKNKSKDLWYEYGQSLFAANELEEARKVFKRSVKSDFKPIQSLYYMGHISEILEEHKETKKNYIKIIKAKGVDKGLKQTTYNQLAELILGLIRKKFEVKKLVQKYVIPLYEKAIAADPNSEMVFDIENRMDQVLLEYDIHPFVMMNGRRVSKKRYTLNLSFSYSNDSNVILTNDLPSATATQKESNIYETTVYGTYRYIWGKRFLLTPEVRASYIDHSEGATEIKQNNSYYYSPALRTSLEHNIGKKEAGFLLEYEFNKTYRDLLGDDNISEYSSSSTFIIGERIGFSNRGETTFKLKYASMSGYIPNLDNSSTTYYLDQMYSIDRTKLMVFLFQYTTTEFGNNASENSTSMVFRTDFIKSQLWGRYSFNLGMMYTILSLEDLEQSTLRGTETVFNPSLGLTRSFGDHFTVSFSYDYQSKSSNDENYIYKKSVYSMLTSYAF